MLAERAKTAYSWASAITLVLLLGLFASSMWRFYAMQHTVARYYGPDANGDRIPDRLEGLYTGLDDPRAQKGVRLLIRSVAEVVTPEELDDARLKLAIFDYYTALDCLYLSYKDGLDKVEQAVLEAMLTDELLKRRYQERTARALQRGLAPEFVPGLLCPF